MWKARPVAVMALALSLVAAGCSVFGGMAADEPAFRVVERDGAIEIREYDGFAVAETTVDAPFDKAVGTGFRRLFDYISGANRRETKIEMTAPVVAEPEGEKIEMTAPVLAEPSTGTAADTAASLAPGSEESWRVAFVLPEGYTAGTAPTPTDPSVTLRDVPERRVAIIGFPGLFRNATGEAKREELASWLAARGLAHRGDWRMAGYNPPWTIPALRRNEVMVTLR